MSYRHHATNEFEKRNKLQSKHKFHNPNTGVAIYKKNNIGLSTSVKWPNSDHLWTFPIQVSAIH